MTQFSSFHRLIAVRAFVLLLISFGAKASGQAPANTGNYPAFAEVATELKEDYGEVRFHREETLEDQFMVHFFSRFDFALMPHFFLVQMPRFDLSGGSLRENIGMGIPTKYVGSSADGAKVYRLYGFSNPEQEFNRLVADSPQLRMSGTGDAEVRGLLCGEIVYGLSPNQWTGDTSGAMIHAAKRFFNAGQEDALLRAEQWWKSVKGDRTAMTIHTIRNGPSGFSVILPTFWAPIGAENVLEIDIHRIDVSETGACHMGPKPIAVLK